MSAKESESPTDKEELVKKVESTIVEDLGNDKKKKEHREKRKRSCSVESVSSSHSHKRHKKKKKKKSKDDPPSPKVNPIFLWVKQDHTKIVEVLCEDYDKRNRIRLTKTAGGWVAIPRTNMYCPPTPKEEVISKEVQTPKPVVEVIKSPVKNDIQPVEKEIETKKEPECTEVKCCPEVNLDENHNNEVDRAEDFCKNLEDDVEEIKIPDSPDQAEEILDDDAEEACDEPCEVNLHQDNCVNLMNELADMCFVENLKEEVEDKDLNDIYTFVPSPSENKDEVKSFTPVQEVKKPQTPEPPAAEPTPINLVVHSEREEEPVKDMKLEPLKQSDLESLDILWRLPEGTTISHSKPLMDAKPVEQRRTPHHKPPPTFSQPIQEEPLNLGKPKPKEDKKREDSKLMELLKTDDSRIQSNPLDQLKEVLSDPDLSVPDPLLVPRARLSALIANPKREIPRLLAQKREVKYPKLDPDLMVVSLAHLQSILQKSGKEDDLLLYQQQMMNSFSHEKMDPATAAINQMLWLPYLSSLDTKHNQELMAMLYPHYVYPQHYMPPPPQPQSRFPYPRPAWPRPETSKPIPPKPEPPKPSPKPKLKVRDNLVEPNQRTNLLKFDPTSPFLPSVGVPPNSNLWHPLFSSPDGKYTSRWNWTTPVTVSGE